MKAKIVVLICVALFAIAALDALVSSLPSDGNLCKSSPTVVCVFDPATDAMMEQAE